MITANVDRILYLSSLSKHLYTMQADLESSRGIYFSQFHRDATRHLNYNKQQIKEKRHILIKEFEILMYLNVIVSICGL